MKVSKFLRRIGFIPALLILLVGAANIAHAQNLVLADKKASKQTQLLYANLLKLTNRGVMFGHQDDLAYGVGWQYIPGRSDVKSVTGSYPAVFGWELGGLEQEKNNNLDGVPFNNIINYTRDVYKWGGINTFSWHFNDPVTKATAWSTPQSSVKQINEGGKNFAAYKNYLNKFAKFARKLKGPDGELIPIIFRTLHENTGNWFWWGSSSCTPAEYVQLWRFTFDYLVKEKKLHNLIFAYSTAFCPTVNAFEERYPGDDYVDIVGFDAYCDDDMAFFVKDLANRFNVLDTIAAKHQKIAALTEVGMNKNIQKNWWTQVLLPELKKHKVAYALSWRNWKKEHYYAPYPGQASAEDFIEFYNDPATLFLNDMDTNVYQ